MRVPDVWSGCGEWRLMAVQNQLEPGASAEGNLLDHVLVGPFGYLAGRVTVSNDGVPPVIPMARLLEHPTFGHALDRYAARFGKADRRAVASLWSQYCFGNLIVPVVAASLLGNRTLPVTPESGGLVLEDGLPSGLDLPNIGWPTRSGDAFERFEPLIRGLIEPLITQLAAYSRASPRLFWSNAAVTLGWAVQEASAVLPGRVDPEPLERQLLDTPTWPDGEVNPLFDTIRPSTGPVEQRRRRVCCVRYPLPGVPGCGALCPLGR
jgi:ferric iron reductase protein FhuF